MSASKPFRKHQRRPPASWFKRPRRAKRPPAPPTPEDAAGAESWGVLPAKPPARHPLCDCDGSGIAEYPRRLCACPETSKARET